MIAADISLYVGNMIVLAVIAAAVIVWAAWDTNNAWRGTSRRRQISTPPIVDEFVEGPIEPELPDAEMFDLPAGLLNDECAGCGRRLKDKAFLCQCCIEVIGQPRMHRLFQMIDQGRWERAWIESERIAKSIRDRKAAAVRN